VNTYEHAQLDALGDGTRRAILARLLLDGPLPVCEIARNVPVSRPAVSQHLRVLKQARLVTDERQGTRRVYGLDPHGFEHVRTYFDQFWTQALTAFARAVDGRRPKEPR
jgi:DNA-binding transcriptional ArsR family regulator